MKSIHTGQWERLNAVIKWSKLSTHAFACEIGLNRSENLYRIKYNKNGVSRKLVMQIANRYSEISDVWLLTGCGSMLKADWISETISIPYYANGINQYNDSKKKYDARFTMPDAYDADFAVDVDSNMVENILPSGSVAFLSDISVKDIVFGKIYYVVLGVYSDFYIISKSSNMGCVVVHDDKASPQSTTEIKLNDIKSIYLVGGYVKKL